MSKSKSKRSIIEGVPVLEITHTTYRSRESIAAAIEQAEAEVGRWSKLLNEATAKRAAAVAELAKLDGE